MIMLHGDEDRRRGEVMSAMLCRLLDRTPSERSEASWSFYSMSERSNRSSERSIAFRCRAGWALMMRAIK
jgi:hypothetical protein